MRRACHASADDLRSIAPHIWDEQRICWRHPAESDRCSYAEPGSGGACRSDRLRTLRCGPYAGPNGGLDEAGLQRRRMAITRFAANDGTRGPDGRRLRTLLSPLTISPPVHAGGPLFFERPTEANSAAKPHTGACHAENTWNRVLFSLSLGVSAIGRQIARRLSPKMPMSMLSIPMQLRQSRSKKKKGVYKVELDFLMKTKSVTNVFTAPIYCG